LPPQVVRARHERYVGGVLVVRLPDHPRFAMARALVVCGREPLDTEHPLAAGREVVGGGAAHPPHSDDDDAVGVQASTRSLRDASCSGPLPVSGASGTAIAAPRPTTAARISIVGPMPRPASTEGRTNVLIAAPTLLTPAARPTPDARTSVGKISDG